LRRSAIVCHGNLTANLARIGWTDGLTAPSFAACLACGIHAHTRRSPYYYYQISADSLDGMRFDVYCSWRCVVCTVSSLYSHNTVFLWCVAALVVELNITTSTQCICILNRRINCKCKCILRLKSSPSSYWHFEHQNNSNVGCLATCLVSSSAQRDTRYKYQSSVHLSLVSDVEFTYICIIFCRA
jgi:hypothetical protein